MIPSPPDTIVSYQDGVLHLEFSRGNRGNAIRTEAVEGLVDFFAAAQANSGIRCIVLSGRGKHFCTGGDVHAFSQQTEQPREKLVADFSEKMDRVSRLVTAICDFDRPVVCACQGTVAGAGLMFLLAADWVIAEPTLNLSFAQGRIGLSPDGGITHLLSRILPARKIAQILINSDTLNADTACDLGLATELVREGQSLDRSMQLAADLSKKSQPAVRAAKTLGYEASRDLLNRQLAREKQFVLDCIQHEDFRVGVKAVLERQHAVFPSANQHDSHPVELNVDGINA